MILKPFIILIGVLWFCKDSCLKSSTDNCSFQLGKSFFEKGC